MQLINDDGFNSYVQWVDSVFGTSGNCRNFSYPSHMLQNRYEQWDMPGTNSGARQWQNLRCTQLGLNRVTAYEHTLFSQQVTHDYYFYACNDILGPR